MSRPLRQLRRGGCSLPLRSSRLLEIRDGHICLIDTSRARLCPPTRSRSPATPSSPHTANTLASSRTRRRWPSASVHIAQANSRTRLSIRFRPPCVSRAASASAQHRRIVRQKESTGTLSRSLTADTSTTRCAHSPGDLLPGRGCLDLIVLSLTVLPQHMVSHVQREGLSDAMYLPQRQARQPEPKHALSPPGTPALPYALPDRREGRRSFVRPAGRVARSGRTGTEEAEIDEGEGGRPG